LRLKTLLSSFFAFISRLDFQSVPDMNSILLAAARRKYVPAGSTPASLRATAEASNIESMSYSYVDQS
jgi:hypothetical protein